MTDENFDIILEPITILTHKLHIDSSYTVF